MQSIKFKLYYKIKSKIQINKMTQQKTSNSNSQKNVGGKTKMKTQTMTDGKTSQDKEYVVIWHYMANHGHDIIKASSPEEAIKKHWYCRQDIEMFAFENNNETSAYKRKGSVVILNPQEVN